MTDQHVLRRKKDNKVYKAYMITPLASRCLGYSYLLINVEDESAHVMLKGKEEAELSQWCWSGEKPKKHFKISEKGTWPPKFQEK